MALNGTQQAMLDSFLAFLFGSCKEDLKLSDSIKVLKAILGPHS